MINRIILSIRKRLAFISPQKTVVRDGITYDLDCREVIDHSIYMGGWEPETLDFIRRFVKPGHTVLEIGANIGAHTLLLAKAVGAGGRVYAVEPTRYAREKLLRNRELNPGLVDRIAVLDYLITDHIDEEQRRSIKSSWRYAHQFEELKDEFVESPAITIDELWENHGEGRSVDVLKVDVDGYDYKALAGASGVIGRFKPVIFVELCEWAQRECGHSVRDIFELLEGHGYVARTLTGTTALNAPDVLSSIGEQGKIDAIFSPAAS